MKLNKKDDNIARDLQYSNLLALKSVAELLFANSADHSPEAYAEKSLKDYEKKSYIKFAVMYDFESLCWNIVSDADIMERLSDIELDYCRAVSRYVYYDLMGVYDSFEKEGFIVTMSIKRRLETEKFKKTIFMEHSDCIYEDLESYFSYKFPDQVEEEDEEDEDED